MVLTVDGPEESPRILLNCGREMVSWPWKVPVGSYSELFVWFIPMCGKFAIYMVVQKKEQGILERFEGSLPPEMRNHKPRVSHLSSEGGAVPRSLDARLCGKSNGPLVDAEVCLRGKGDQVS